MTYLLSQQEKNIFGTFHYLYGLVEHTTTRKSWALLQDGETNVKRGKSKISLDEQVKSVYSSASLFHETRHFHDQFGTLGGLSIVTNFFGTLRSFDSANRRLEAEAGRWQWPALLSSGGLGAPIEVRQAIRQMRAFKTGTALLKGSFKPLEVEGHLTAMMLEAQTSEGHTFDVAADRQIHFNDGEKVEKTVLFPLGLETLFESNAHAISRTLAEHYFPKDVADRLSMQIFYKNLEDDETANLAEYTLPYMILDRLITKYIANRGQSKFYRNTVIGIADEVLSQIYFRIQHISPQESQIYVSRAGELIMEALHRTSTEDLFAGQIRPSDVVQEGYTRLAENLAKSHDWDSIEDDGSFRSAIDIWEAYCMKHFTLPLVELRLATDHRAFRTFEGNFELFKAIPPPLLAQEGGRKVDLPEPVHRAWAKVVFGGQIMLELLQGGDLLCPRAYGTVPGLNRDRFCSKNTCDDYIKLGCGRWDGVRVENTPCIFTDALKRVQILG